MCIRDSPYAVPVSFAIAGKSAYIHCAPEGRKIDMILRNPRASLCAVSRAETVPGTASHDTLYEYFGEKTVEPLPPEKKHGWLWRLFHPNKKKLHGNEA